MPLRLVPVRSDDFPQWMQRCCAEYAADLVALGGSADEARRHAESSIRESFPAGHPLEDNAVFDLIDDTGRSVGYLWLGRDQSQDPTSWWVWDVVVDAEYRGRGLGREAMQLAEEYARSRGAVTLGLSVFGFNRPARQLYESLGYEITSVKMRKSLETAEAPVERS
ncbi:GNAT family N-acetyltransferase [Microbacterium karelineae]|uniref:GNAT family N-acetyltransferase n=1 Tax=Microbacterium karelineae TaxID=2654283 RepID=UPI0012EAC1A3|nr:GNAT family N-acetyltransferase [Microbacterium karelineae]